MVSPEFQNHITPFQRWILLKFHQNPKQSITATDLITTCCITAMDDDFNKRDALTDILELENAELITRSDDFVEGAEGVEREYGVIYASTIDGIIFAKKMMKPILDAMNKKEFESALQKLDDPQALKFIETLYRDPNKTNQITRLYELAEYGLSNISAFGKLWNVFHQAVELLK